MKCYMEIKGLLENNINVDIEKLRGFFIEILYDKIVICKYKEDIKTAAFLLKIL